MSFLVRFLVPRSGLNLVQRRSYVFIRAPKYNPKVCIGGKSPKAWHSYQLKAKAEAEAEARAKRWAKMRKQAKRESDSFYSFKKAWKLGDDAIERWWRSHRSNNSF